MVAVVVCRGGRRIAAVSSHVCGAACDSCSCRVAKRPSRRCWVRHDFSSWLDAAAAFGDRICASGVRRGWQPGTDGRCTRVTRLHKSVNAHKDTSKLGSKIEELHKGQRNAAGQQLWLPRDAQNAAGRGVVLCGRTAYATETVRHNGESLSFVSCVDGAIVWNDRENYSVPTCCAARDFTKGRTA